MKTGREFWAPDPSERAAEITARRKQLEREYIAPIRARIALLQGLRPAQTEIIERLIEEVLQQPRDDFELRSALTRLNDYIARRWADPRNAPAPLSDRTRAAIAKALEANGVEPTEDEVIAAWARANAKVAARK